MWNISVIGSVCIDNIKWTYSNKQFKSFGGILYLVTALSVLFKEKASIFPVTKIEKKYRKRLLQLLKPYKNIRTDYIYNEPGKTNIVSLIYDSNHKHRCEKSFLWNTPITYSQIKPVLNFSDMIVISYISGYDISLKTLERIRKNFDGIIYGDIHSYILTKSQNNMRRYKNIKNPEIWLKNFDIVQGSEIEWQVLLKNRYNHINIKNIEKIANHIFSYSIKRIVITRSEQGVWGIEKNRFYNILGKKITKITDTTGCGDTLTAGLIWGLLSKNNFKAGLKIGNELAALKAQRTGFFNPKSHIKLFSSN